MSRARTDRDVLNTITLGDVCKIYRKGEEIDARLVRVLDGDTIEVAICIGTIVVSTRIRIRGIDCPETRMNRKIDRYHVSCGMMVKELITEILTEHSDTMKVVRLKHDKFGGRYVGDVLFNGTRLSTFLLEHGLAQNYSGRTRKPFWTREQLQHVVEEIKRLRVQSREPEDRLTLP